MLGTIWLLLLQVALIGAVVVFITQRLVDRLIVRPIIELAQRTDRFGQAASAEWFPPSDRSDEVGALSRAIRAMAERVEASRLSLEAERHRFARASVTDALTGLGNRRALESALGLPLFWSGPVGLAVIDLDLFKAVNDRFGHDVGDLVLRQLAQVLTGACREGDLLSRSGGEEFCLACRIGDLEAAERWAERLRVQVEQASFGFESNPLRMTCSIGFVVVPEPLISQPWKCWPDWVKVADLAMYEAKQGGRNRWSGYLAASSASEPPTSAAALAGAVASSGWSRRPAAGQ
jgi:diguanylate cyclase (GGDEF)-like protein